jgi:hypothetical protein
LGLASCGRHGFVLWFSWSLPPTLGGGVHGPWPGWLGRRIWAGEPRSGGCSAHPSRVLRWSACWRHGGAKAVWLVDRLLPITAISRRLSVSMSSVRHGGGYLLAGLRSWMPGRRPWKVDCMGGSAASDVAAVVVSLFGHVDGEEWAVGDPGGGSSQIAFGGLTWRWRAGRDLEGGAKVFPGESPALCRQRWRCLRVS